MLTELNIFLFSASPFCLAQNMGKTVFHMIISSDVLQKKADEISSSKGLYMSERISEKSVYSFISIYVCNHMKSTSAQ